MKKSIALLLALLLAFSGMSVLAEESLLSTSVVSEVLNAEETEAPEEDAAPEAEEAPEEETAPDAEEVDNELVVGSTTRLSGSFFTEMWGNNTADIDVRYLLHGYNLMEWVGAEGLYAIDESVVSGLIITEEENGDHTYTIDLAEDLKYSDGTQITAWDYAFSILLSVAPEVREIGGQTIDSDYIAGVDAYKSGEASALSGVRVIDDTMLSITIKADYLPFFYEKALLDYNPYPISVIAPGCVVADDGEGIYIRNADPQVEEPIFTAELLRETILDAETGYLSHPSVVSGPYRLVSFDAATGTAEFEINEFYKGNSAGQTPRIERLVYKNVTNETMISELASGEIDLLNKVTAASTLDEGMALAYDDAFQMSSYARSGCSFFSFNCEQTAVSSQAVRQAIASCLDKDALVEAYVGSYGLRVDGYYGLGQWMVQIVNKTLAAPVEEFATDEEKAEWDALSLDNVKVWNLDLDAAAELLDGDGWTLNREGEAFDPETDDVRCKEIDGEIVPLELSLIYPEGNAIGDSLQSCFIDNLASVGIQMTVEAKPMTELLRIYYRQQERDCDLIYLATNFNTVFDPSSTFDPSDAYQGVNNRTAIADEELYQCAVQMRMTDPENMLEYCQKWVAFQERFAEVLPIIPVYSNVYFDFYTDVLQDYDAGAHMTWSQAIVGAWLGEAVEEVGEEEIAID